MSLFAKGGPVMYLLVGLSLYMLAVIIFKIYQFVTARVLDEKFVEPVITEIRQQRFDSAVKQLAANPGPLAVIMQASLAAVRDRTLTQESRIAEVQRVGTGEVRYLESHLRGLELIANIGPLLGLLGTVTGMVGAFSKLQQQGARVDPSQLAGGIWEALLSTVGGLIVAIPALAAYHLLDGVVERVRARMRDVSVRILTMDDVIAHAENQQRAREEEAREERREAARREEEDRILNARLSEQERLVIEQQRLERDRDALRAEQERLRSEAENVKNSPQKLSTLMLLSPKYPVS